MKFNKFLVFFIPVFLGLPDVAINTGVINLRIDDLLTYILLFSVATGIIKFKKNIFIKMQYYLFFYAFISFLIVLVSKPLLVSEYEAFRAFGSLPFLLVIPYILQEPVFRKIFFKGAIFGGLIYLISLGNNYNTIMMQSEMLKTSGVFKREISFDTLNPNAVASIGLILGWMNFLHFYENKNKLTIIISCLLLAIPLFIFARGYSLGVILAIIIFIILQKKTLKNYFYYFMISTLGVFLFFNLVDQALFESATDIDLESGKGLSGRYELWKNGIDLSLKHPIFGNGFSTEMQLYKNNYNGHMSHQVLLRYSIELGLINLIIFILFIITVLINRFLKYKKTANIIYLIQFAILLCFIIADMSSQLLYFNKYAYLIYALVLFNINKNESSANLIE